jgi:hypothetical protein
MRARRTNLVAVLTLVIAGFACTSDPVPSDSVGPTATQRSASPSIGLSTSDPTTSPMPAKTNMPPTTLPDKLAWHTITEPFIADLNQEVRGLFVNARGELAAWGSESGGDVRRALLWTSADAVVWRKTLFDSLIEDSLLVDVASGPIGFAAVGWTGLTRAAWSSGDGESWTRSTVFPEPVPEAGNFEAVAAGRDGFLAVGGIGENGHSRAAAWFSETGRGWTRVEGHLPLGYFSDVTAGPDGGFIVVGVDQSDADWDAAVWVVSADGLEVRTAGASPALDSSDDDYLYYVSSFVGRYVAFGQVTPRSGRNCLECWDPSWWRTYASGDGITWNSSVISGNDGIDPPVPGDAPVESWDDGLIAVGRGADPTRRVWMSSDGVAWTAVGDPVTLPGPNGPFAGVADVLVADDRLVIGGALGTAGYVSIATGAP